MRIRKQVFDLKSEDLERHPIWEFALDEEGEEGQDEATVRPYSVAGPANSAEGTLIVRARFTLADGTRMLGWITPPSEEFAGLGTIQPQIITSDGPVSFWYGVLKPTREDMARNYEMLGRMADRIFPVHYESDVEVVGGPVKGILKAFYYMELENEKIYEIN
jgi:hypothetical protein